MLILPGAAVARESAMVTVSTVEVRSVSPFIGRQPTLCLSVGGGAVAVIGQLRPRYETVSLCGAFILGAEYVVGPLLVVDHVVGVVGRGVFRRLVQPDAGGHGGHRPVDIAVAEKGKGVALVTRAVDGAVRRCEKAVVGPALQQLASVYHISVR